MYIKQFNLNIYEIMFLKILMKKINWSSNRFYNFFTYIDLP